MPENVAFIPARGGSRRLPKKNLIEFKGKPMLAHTVEAALKSGVFSQVVFSSDHDQMLACAEKYGATAFKRPAEFATDTSTFLPAVTQAAAHFNWPDKNRLCLLMPNCPLRTYEDIQKSAEYFNRLETDFMISVFSYHMFNPRWALSLDKGELKPYFPREFAKNDGPKLLCPTGAIWWARLGAYLSHGDFYGPGLQPFVMPWHRAVDIDTTEDLEMARMVAAGKKLSN
jgi:N-acylneuraminate cytidylyltransferase